MVEDEKPEQAAAVRTLFVKKCNLYFEAVELEDVKK